MGRIDKYSYHSESGSADGTPGRDRDGPKMEKNECDECGGFKKSVVKRLGGFQNRRLCTSCVNELQDEDVSQKHAQTLRTIRGDDK